ncbi:CHAP domain-containing protein, partial [Neisseria sp. P0001.S005]
SSTVNELSSKDKLQNLLSGLKHDKVGTFTAKALADNADVVANIRDELRETLQQHQAQEVAQNTPQVQEQRSYGGRSF